MFSMFYAQGTTNGSARAGAAAPNTIHRVLPTGDVRGGINEYRYTVWIRGLMGPFSLTHRHVPVRQQGSRRTRQLADSGAVPGRNTTPT
jgi:hypothetical protein